ncbi:MAG: outer membrane protein transport protein, partial [Flavobacteriaceae bacterium]|nr:outer membrane protein transport protein [Flavobacteriaceae bacterium]
AGASVFKNSLFSASVNLRNTDITSSYYGNNSTTQEEYFNFSQAGAVFVYKTYENSDWSKFAFSFNYSIRNDYKDRFLSSGNSGFSTFTEFPLDTENPKTQYTNADSQRFSNTTSGELAEYNFALSGVYQNDLHLGVAVNTYDLKFSQRSTLREQNNDGNGNILNAKFYQENITTGTGFSLSAGAIYKATKSLRFGFSYQSPTWFTEMNEESNILNNDGFFGDTEIEVTGSNTIYDNTTGNNFPVQGFSYKLKTPAKTTASIAYIFGSNGLISADYTINDYKKMKLSNADFNTENQFFNDQLRNSYTLNIGSEWRFKALSLRGGYHYEQSPDANAIESDNIKGYSFGAGYNFGNTKLDFAYQNKSNTQQYSFYPQYNQVNAAELNLDNRIITATLTINL